MLLTSTIKPDEFTQLLENVWGYINSQNVAKALDSCKKLTQSWPTNAEAWFASSFLYFQLRNVEQALLTIEKAIELEPQAPRWQVHKAHILLLLGEKLQALALLTPLMTKAFDDVELCAELALVYNKLQCYHQSISFYQQAINLSPSDAGLYFNLASVQRYLGLLNEAEVNFNWAIFLNAHDYEAYLQRASLRKQTVDDNHVQQLKKLLTTNIVSPIGKAQVCYALAKELEDLQEYQASFEYLTLGATSRRQNIKYDANHDLVTLEKIKQVFDASLFSQTNNEYSDKSSGFGDKNRQAIFILGLPRTGTTLIERIISNHQQVKSAGELNDFAVQMMTQIKNLTASPVNGASKSRLELITLSRQLNFAQLGQTYLKNAKGNLNASINDNEKFIDKLPLNSLYVGLIHLALPNAKIIYVKRDPLDTIYAMYKQLFTHGYPFSYDLNELTQYYIAHYKLMQHWQAVLPNAIYTVNYEDVINNVDEQAKLLIDYCDLGWQPQCSEFQYNKAPSTTASASQVRQGIYKSSQGKWQHYPQQLSSVKAQLEQAGIL
ncbi:MAG: sulfotransferase [Alteromonadaceae bacterium]|nr:sulfotransferase [Alteromonadaceae bacterium]